MKTMNYLTVTITTAPRPDLLGPVTFRHPTLYAHLAIGRRATELANTGAPTGAVRIAVSDLPADQQRSVQMVATLEHVIHSAPKGFYRADDQGHPLLDMGQFDEFDADYGDSLLWTLYAAYLKWRSDFRRTRNRVADGTEAE